MQRIYFIFAVHLLLFFSCYSLVNSQLVRLGQIVTGTDRISGQLEVRNSETDDWRKVCRKSAYMTLDKLGEVACNDLGYRTRSLIEPGKRGSPAGRIGWYEISNCTPSNTAFTSLLDCNFEPLPQNQPVCSRGGWIYLICTQKIIQIDPEEISCGADIQRTLKRHEKAVLRLDKEQFQPCSIRINSDDNDDEELLLVLRMANWPREPENQCPKNRPYAVVKNTSSDAEGEEICGGNRVIAFYAGSLSLNIQYHSAELRLNANITIEAIHPLECDPSSTRISLLKSELSFDVPEYREENRVEGPALISSLGNCPVSVQPESDLIEYRFSPDSCGAKLKSDGSEEYYESVMTIEAITPREEINGIANILTDVISFQCRSGNFSVSNSLQIK